ncbi:SGNH/GDSL hydrolase family protein [Actinoplanes sp. NPDC051343]|uniref:SGNH/GDSL hydrolase family protein n=1 Tax=Actinoplanes sp. NPDC051343 TaxID=3363906 RepID=UPI0037B01272
MTKPLAAVLVCAAMALTVAPAGAATATEAAPLKVMPLGDSITNGLGSIPYAATVAWLDAHPGSRTDPDWEEAHTDPYNGYRPDLKARLNRAGLRTDFVGSRHSGTFGDVQHEGHPGWTIEQINDVLADRLHTYRPDVILMHLGTNNSRRDTYTAAAPEAYRRTIEIIKAHDPAAVVFVAEIVDSARYDATGVTRARRIDLINAAVPGIVAAAGPNFHLVDMSDIHGLDLADAVHPNGAGYAKMAWKWYQAMNGVLGAGRWPAGNDPYSRTRVSRCISWTAAPFARYAVGCHTWYLNRAKQLWQLPVVTTRTVKVGGTTRKVSSTRWITGW